MRGIPFAWSHQDATGARRGSYAPLFGVTAIAFVSFVAFAVDTQLVRLGRTQVQAVADAAAHAAVVELQRTGDSVEADAVARSVVAANSVQGTEPQVTALTFGYFDESSGFSPGSAGPNSVRVTVSANPRLGFRGLWGRETVEVQGAATGALDATHLLLAIDITNSWSAADFAAARAGILAVFDTYAASAGVADRIGMVLFMNRYGVEYTPLTLVSDAVSTGVRAQWEVLDRASKGSQAGNPLACENGNDFSTGGCRPQMFREYSDEGGTDHAVGIQYGHQVLATRAGESAQRVMIVLTDGRPANVSPALYRDTLPPEEQDTRWTYWKTAETRTANEIRTEAPIRAQTAWDELGVHTWVVSYDVSLSEEPWMDFVPHGDGDFVLAEDSSDIGPIFLQILATLPLGLVE